jgi:alkaline phosphatase D
METIISRKNRNYLITATRSSSSRPLLLLVALFLLILFVSCSGGSKTTGNHAAIACCDKPAGTFRVAFGSCSKQDKPQGIWKSITACQPDIWIWLGDAIYARNEDVVSMANHYVLQKANPDYQALARQTRIIGVWDDHDFGTSKAGKKFLHKRESQKLYLDFIGEPLDSPRRHQEAIYASYMFGEEGRQVKVFLLDVRSDCDDPGPYSDLLGNAQWAWLERELNGSRAQVNLVCSGSQILPVDQPYDKWANYGISRQRLISLIQSSRVPGVILISGDRHLAEISLLQGPETNYPLYEVTSSGLTHTVAFWWHLRNLFKDEKNRYRVGQQLPDLNFGTIDINWSPGPGQITLEVHDRSGAERLKQVVPVLQLQPPPVSHLFPIH